MDIVELAKDYSRMGARKTAEKYGLKPSNVYDIINNLKKMGAKIPSPRNSRVQRPWKDIASAVNAELHPYSGFKKLEVNPV